MCFIFSKKAREERKARRTILKMDDMAIDCIVKIQGTQFDRKRKFTDAQISEITHLKKNGKSWAEIARQYNADSRTIRYNIDPEYRAENLRKQTGKHTGITHLDFDNRVTYKRKLIKEKKISAAGLIL